MGDRPYHSPQTDRAPRRGRSHSRSRSLSRDRDRPSRSTKDDHVPRRYSHSRSRSRSHSLSRSPVRRRRSRSRSRDRSRGRNAHYDRPDRNQGSKRSPSPRRRKSRSRSPDRKRRRRSHSRSRSRSRSVSPDRRKRKRRKSRSVSSSSSRSSDEGRDRERRRKRKEKHRKRSRSRDRKERKRDKKKDKKKKKIGAVTSQYGKYGIINESDLYNKGQEFRAWLVEERKINPETQSKESTRKEFAQFTEDYNTATLPHEKYYNMDAYERRMNALRHGELLPAGDELTYDVNADLKAHSSTHKRKAIERESYLSKEQLMELRKVQNERIEAGKMKLLGMDLPQHLGVRMDGTTFDG